MQDHPRSWVVTIGDRKTDREAFGDHYDTWKGWTFDLVEGRAYTAKSHGKKEAKYGKSGKYITLKDRKGLHRMIMAAYLAARGGKYIKICRDMLDGKCQVHHILAPWKSTHH